MASYPIFRTLIGHSDTFSGNAFETVQVGRDNLLLPFQGRNDCFCQRMVRSRLGSKQYIFIMLLLPCAHSQPITVGCPSVRVPVLSNTTTSTLRICSKAEVSLIRI